MSLLRFFFLFEATIMLFIATGAIVGERYMLAFYLIAGGIIACIAAQIVKRYEWRK